MTTKRRPPVSPPGGLASGPEGPQLYVVIFNLMLSELSNPLLAQPIESTTLCRGAVGFGLANFASVG